MISGYNPLFNIVFFLSSFIDIRLLFFILALWSLLWKGFALWVSARKGERFWFVLLLILNTVGVLEIFYLLYKKYVKTENGIFLKLKVFGERLFKRGR